MDLTQTKKQMTAFKPYGKRITIGCAEKGIAPGEVQEITKQHLFMRPGPSVNQ